jgi:uncharacterized membrane protein
MQPEFPAPFKHEHEPVRNVNELVAAQLTLSQRASDTVARITGSWRFIIGQSIFFTLWAALNVTAWVKHWDPYPFILMNLFLSLQAAYTAPIIMMSQNRQTERDRVEAHNDYIINQKAEKEVRAILDHLAAQDKALAGIFQKLHECESKLTPP